MNVHMKTWMQWKPEMLRQFHTRMFMCQNREKKKVKENGSNEAVNLRQGGGLVMQKETFGNWSFTGCGWCSSCLGCGAAPPPAILPILLQFT